MLDELQLIKNNFNHAASTYIANSLIQNTAAKKIATYLCHKQYKNTPQKNNLILDLGSGPGTFHETEIANYTNLKPSTILYDLSLNMLKVGKKLGQNNRVINGDANRLPFANNVFDLIISNLMLQWPKNKLPILHEINRVLVPNGIVVFTTLVKPSLWQLQDAWQPLDNKLHVLDFATIEEYQSLCHEANLEIIDKDVWEDIVYFADIFTLFKHFKLTGTSLLKSNCNLGLGGRKALNALGNLYPRHPGKEQLPLSYHYLMIVAKKRNTA